MPRVGTEPPRPALGHITRQRIAPPVEVYLTYRLLRGLDALPSMRLFTAGRYRFQDEPVDRADPALPPTPDLLALLRPEHTGTVEPPQTESTAGTAKAPDSLWLLIERELAEFLGPRSSLICEEHLAQPTDLDSPKALARLVEAIANEIGDPHKRGPLQAAGSLQSQWQRWTASVPRLMPQKGPHVRQP